MLALDLPKEIEDRLIAAASRVGQTKEAWAADAIVELKKQGLAILLSEQNIAFAKYVADRAYIVENGHIKWAGRVNELDDVAL